MQVKLTVPSDLGGASLLGVHNWIKSQVARSNPGGSPDYTIMDMNGNQLTLSDVARNPNTEIMVNVIDGVRSNPQGYLAPVPGLEMEYPQLPRSGNDVMMLMPDDLDPTLVQRIVAEQGLNRGLHTLNRLLLMQSPGEAVSPQTAAILQMGDKLRMSRAVRSNPSDRTPFTQRTPHYYSPEEALGKYVREYMGADGVKVSEGEGRLIAADAKLANKYALNQAKIQAFARNVLAEYLFAASANRGLLRTIVRNNPDLREERELMQRLLAIFPQQPRAFYEGSINVFVANPLFIYPAYADTLLTNRQINTILDFARDYPHNMRGRSLPRGMSNLVYSIRGRNSYWSRLLNATLGRRYLFGSPSVQLDSATDLDDQIDAEGLRRVTRRFANDPEGRRQEYFRRFATDRPLAYFSNLGGMYPTVPSKWPPALVYAIMDGFLEKLGEIVNMEDPTQFGFSPIRMTGRLRPANDEDTFMITVQDPFEPGRTFSLVYPDDMQEIVEANYTFAALRGPMNAPFGQPGAAPQATRFRIPDGIVGSPGYPNNAAVRSAAAEAIERALREGHHQALTEREGSEDGNVTGATNIEITSTHQISLLEMAYHIAEIAQVKYNYNARGDDFMFIMAMCQISLDSLRQQVAPAAPVNPLAGLIAPPAGGGGPLGGIIAPPVNALPGAVEIGNAVPHAPAVNAAAAQADIEDVLNEGDPDELAALGPMILNEFDQLDVVPGFADLFNEVERRAAQQPLNNPRRATVRSARVERIKQNLEALQGINEQIDDRVVRAIRGALNQEAHDFLDQVGQVSLHTVSQASKAFDSALMQLVATYKECIEQITDAIDDNFNSIFESEGKNLKYNYESVAEIYQALNAADAMATNAKLRFESKLEGFRDHTNVMRGVAGASPGVVAAIERAIAVNTESTDIIIELDTTIEFIQDAELILNTDGITGDAVVRLYRALIMIAEKLAEMVNAINTLNKTIGRGEDERSITKVGKSFNEILEVIEHDLRTLDPILYKDQIEALRAIRPNDNYPQIKANVDEALAVL